MQWRKSWVQKILKPRRDCIWDVAIEWGPCQPSKSDVSKYLCRWGWQASDSGGSTVIIVISIGGCWMSIVFSGGFPRVVTWQLWGSIEENRIISSFGWIFDRFTWKLKLPDGLLMGCTPLLVLLPWQSEVSIDGFWYESGLGGFGWYLRTCCYFGAVTVLPSHILVSVASFALYILLPNTQIMTYAPGKQAPELTH